MDVDQVWLSWLDNPEGCEGCGPSARITTTCALQLADARDALTASRDVRQARPRRRSTLEVLNDVLGFFGAGESAAPPEMPAKAVQGAEDARQAASRGT